MGVRVCAAGAMVALVALLQLSAASTVGAASAAPSSCSKGDSECFCKQLGAAATWKSGSRANTPLLPACKLSYDTKDGERYVHVYLPPSYDGVKQFPIWVHLHGVFWATMGDIGKRAGVPVNGTDIIPAFDHSVELLGDKAVLVYPQSGGDPGRGDPEEGQGKRYRQFWNLAFWSCSVGICAPKIDDVAFLEQVIADLPTRLPLKPGHYLLTGESAGGMMVHALLCQSKVVPATVDAAVDILGGVGADFAAGPECRASPAIPFLKLHGETDPFITYDKQILVDGVNFGSAIEATQLRARANGCSVPGDAGPKDVPEAGGKMRCTDWCGGKAGSPPAKLCGMPGVGHDTDFPHPGFVYEQSWAWFDALPKSAGKKAATGTASSSSGSTSKGARAARNITATGPLQLNVTLPGASLADFADASSPQAAAALQAVSAATGLPARNISARYATASRRRHALARRHLLAEAAAAAAAGSSSGDAGVVGTYTLRTDTPRRVSRSVAAAVRDGSLLGALRRSGLVSAAGAGPTLSMAAAGSSDQPIIKPVELAAQAPGAGTAGSTKTAAAPAAATDDELLNFYDEQQPAAAAPEGSSSGSSINVPAIVGGVVGSVAGAALLAGVGVWAARAARTRKQQQLQEREWAQQAAAKEQQQQPRARSGVINLSAASDASMVISEPPRAAH